MFHVAIFAPATLPGGGNNFQCAVHDVAGSPVGTFIARNGGVAVWGFQGAATQQADGSWSFGAEQAVWGSGSASDTCQCSQPVGSRSNLVGTVSVQTPAGPFEYDHATPTA